MLFLKILVGIKLCVNKVQGVSFVINVLNEDCILYYGEYRIVFGDIVIIFVVDLMLYGKIWVKMCC